MTAIEQKRAEEKTVVSKMIHLYCKKVHHTKEGLCPQCEALERYTHTRSDHCPFMENKTFCANCRVHCYRPDMREQIRTVMRFSGPRMLFVEPKMTIRHVITTRQEKRRLKRESACK